MPITPENFSLPKGTPEFEKAKKKVLAAMNDAATALFRAANEGVSGSRVALGIIANAPLRDDNEETERDEEEHE